MAMDEQSQAEQLDAFDDETEDARLEDMPPDKPWGAEAYGAGGTETPDTVAARAVGEEPDELVAEEEIAAGLYESEDGFAEDDEDQSVAQQGEAPGRLWPRRPRSTWSTRRMVTWGGLDPDGPLGDGYIDVDGDVLLAGDGGGEQSPDRSAD